MRTQRQAMLLRMILVVAGAVTLLAGCIVPAGNPQLVGYVDFPDPAAVPNYAVPGLAQLYGTGTPQNGNRTITTEVWQAGTNNFGSVGEAIPVKPDWLRSENWAPTVRYIGGQYVMWFSASVTFNNTHCLANATSPTAGGPFIVGPSSRVWCDSNPSNVGLFDPSLFVDPSTGVTMLTWSRQWAPGGGSEIVGWTLAQDGLTPTSAEFLLVTFNQVVVALQAGGYYPFLGGRSYIENPQYLYNSTTPQYGAYTFSASLGTYSERGAYHTIGAEYAFLVVVDSLLLQGTGSNPPPNPRNLDNPGGLSALTDVDVGNYLLFAAPYIGSVSPRYPWWEGVSVTQPQSAAAGVQKAFGSDKPPNLERPILPPNKAPYRAPYRVPADLKYTPPVPR